MCDVNKLHLGLAKCDSKDIVVYVVEKIGKNKVTLEICRKCWDKIADKDKFYQKGKLK